jgi:putative flippase GtrA
VVTPRCSACKHPDPCLHTSADHTHADHGRGNANAGAHQRSNSMSVSRQFSIFVMVGLIAAIFHYAALIGLVEFAHWRAVPATLVGFICGGVVSYILNRRHTFDSNRPHEETGWRFALVAGIGFCITWIAMHVLTNIFGAPYLPAQVVTTGVVMFWNFLANRLWTFRIPTVA